MRTLRKGRPLVQKVRTVQPCDPPQQAKNPRAPRHRTQRSNATWCLRHGQTGHSTATCDIGSAPILLPPEELKEQFENVCLWCNLYGHTMLQCMRRAPVLAIENHTAIGEPKTEMGALKKAISEVQDAEKDLPKIRRQLEGIENWQSSVDTRITQAAALARDAQSTAAAATPGSRFEAYLRDEFQLALQRILDVEHTAAAAMPVTTFNDWLSRFKAQQDPFSPRPVTDPSSAQHDTSAQPPASASPKKQSSSLLPSQAQQTTAPTSPIPAVGEVSMHMSSGMKRPVGDSDEGSQNHRRTRARSGTPCQSSTPNWVTLPPLPADVWKNEVVELLFFEWNKDKDQRLITWLERHSTEEMTLSIVAVEGEALTTYKKAAITTVLRATKANPQIFSDIWSAA